MITIYVLGALQSAVWFFVTPHVCKYIWPRLFGQHQAEVAELLLWCGLLPYFVLYLVVVALPPYYLNWGFFEQYKVSDEEWPWRSMHKKVRDRFWKTARSSLVLDVFYLSVFPLIAWVKIVAFGSVMFDTTEDWPTYSESAFQIMSFVVLHEMMFYWIHRASHPKSGSCVNSRVNDIDIALRHCSSSSQAFHNFPSLYKYHKIHHQYKQNNVLASQHFSVVDFFFSIAFPSIACTIIVRPHSVCLLQAALWLITANLDDHLGYAFPWSPVRWFPFAATTEAHEFHHRCNIGCFSSKLNLDAVFGTDGQGRLKQEKD